MGEASARIRRFIRDRRGGVAMVVGLSAPVLALATAGAVELAEVSRTHAALQAYVDAAALRGAREFAIDQSAATVERSRTQADDAANAVRPKWTISTLAVSDPTKGMVTVTQDAVRGSFFGSLVPPNGFQVHVTATATTLTSRSPLCVLGIQQAGSGVIQLRETSVVTANTCLVQSNSDIKAADGAQLRAGSVQSVNAATGAISPRPVTDAPPIADPFASLPISVPAGCSDTDFVVSGTTTLNPGVHCGKIKINGSDRLVLNPGEHYFVDADIDVVGSGQITGTDVVLIFKKSFDVAFKGEAFLSLEGRRSGPYAGFVIVTDREFKKAVELSTSRARQLLGTVYLPNAELRVSGTANKVADQSPWTVIVARNIRVEGSAELIVNSGYFASAVPVPKGVATNVSSRLVQ